MDSQTAKHGYIDSVAVHAYFSICFMASDMLAFLYVTCIIPWYYIYDMGYRKAKSMRFKYVGGNEMNEGTANEPKVEAEKQQ